MARNQVDTEKKRDFTDLASVGEVATLGFDGTTLQGESRQTKHII